MQVWTLEVQVIAIGKCYFVMDFEASSNIVIVWRGWMWHTRYMAKSIVCNQWSCVMLYYVWIARIAHMIEFNDGVKILFIRIIVDKDNILLRTHLRWIRKISQFALL